METYDTSSHAFLNQFLSHRAINKEFYEKVPENKFDFHMVNTKQRKSDSPRESIIHQIYVTRKYIYGVKTGRLVCYGITEHEKDLSKKTKSELLKVFDTTTQELCDVISKQDISTKMIRVPWSKTSITAIACLYGLVSHEILHTGWNLALMDHLAIERFPRLKDMWG